MPNPKRKNYPDKKRCRNYQYHAGRHRAGIPGFQEEMMKDCLLHPKTRFCNYSKWQINHWICLFEKCVFGQEDERKSGHDSQMITNQITKLQREIDARQKEIDRLRGKI